MRLLMEQRLKRELGWWALKSGRKAGSLGNCDLLVIMIHKCWIEYSRKKMNRELLKTCSSDLVNIF